MNRNFILHTKDLTLKSIGDTDILILAHMLIHPLVGKTYMVPDYADEAEAAESARRIASLSYSPDRFVYGIYLGECLIGLLNDCGMSEHEAEVGYVIHPDYWNHGYATQALQVAIGELARLGYRTKTGYFEQNVASRRVMEKCGMLPLPDVDTVEYRGAQTVRYFLSCEAEPCRPSLPL